MPFVNAIMVRGAGSGAGTVSPAGPDLRPIGKGSGRLFAAACVSPPPSEWQPLQPYLEASAVLYNGSTAIQGVSSALEPMYQSNCYAGLSRHELSVVLPVVPEAPLSVRLHFAENHASSGERVFDIYVNNQPQARAAVDSLHRTLKR